MFKYLAINKNSSNSNFTFMKKKNLFCILYFFYSKKKYIFNIYLRSFLLLTYECKLLTINNFNKSYKIAFILYCLCLSISLNNYIPIY